LTSLCDEYIREFSIHLLASGCDIRTVQDVPGHDDVRATVRCTYVLNREGKGVKSPVDDL
jgi:site-specific recombinase XerD